MEKKKFKGRKYYGIVSHKYEDSKFICWVDGDIEKAKRGLRDVDDVLVEMEVKKVFIKERDIKETENELL